MKQMKLEWNPQHSALLIVDVQNDYCHKEGCLAKQDLDVSMVEEMMPNLKNMIATMKEENVPIIYIQTIHENSTDSETWIKRLKGKNQTNLCRKDTWGAEFYQLEPDNDDVIVIKHRYSAFINTRLDSVLRALKIETLLMAGVSTNICVESTARDGFMLDYDVIFLSDCTAAFSREAHNMTLQTINQFFGTVVTSNEVIQSIHAIPVGSE
ncbi:cysteine hydrolase [Niallia circulans]|jgi:ureidoacrylate peracid hydrolase|uniref:Isochorismatase family cysteine hydrolase n=2 Tax=Bacillales TaxID=1385 RepID=A0ABV1F6L0_9BACI|nr:MULTISPECIES: isochorismatase family cysteine hydrolase [Bacillaceae]MCF2647736.1 cysteine hydrolase [Niallia circulans]